MLDYKDDKDNEGFICKFLVETILGTDNHELLLKVSLEGPLSEVNHKSLDSSFVATFHKGLHSLPFFFATVVKMCIFYSIVKSIKAHLIREISFSKQTHVNFSHGVLGLVGNTC